MSILKRILCSLSGKHSAIVFVRNIYGDEIYEWGGNRSLWRCKNCGGIEAWPYLNNPEVTRPAKPIDEPTRLRNEIAGLLRDLRMSARVIGMQLQTIKELEAQIEKLSSPSQDTPT